MWEPRVETDGPATTLVIQNRGIDRASGVTVQLDPPPSRFLTTDTGEEPREVDLGAIVRLEYLQALSSEPPQRVTVRWKRRLLREGVWSSPI
jgi:hypothetical protein